MPDDALDVYEALRSASLRAQPRAIGVAAIRFHGMVNGLVLLSQGSASTVAAGSASIGATRIGASSPNDAFVHLVANLVLRNHSELIHVY